MTAESGCRIDDEHLLAYLLTELVAGEVERLEEHLFECDDCAHRLEALALVRDALSGNVAVAALGGSVNRAFLDRAARDGLSLRDYRIPAGETVACTAGPEDLVVVRLGADFSDLDDLQLDGTFLDIERQEESPLPTREVVADRQLDEVVLVFPGALVRGYPRSRWTLRLRGESSSGACELGPFVMDHHP